MSENFSIVTISNRRPTEWYYLYDQLFKSLNGHQPIILGTNPGEFTGLGDKPRLLYNAINEGKINSKYIIFVDAWDVVFAHSPEIVMEKSAEFKSPIVIGAEKNCFPSYFKKEYDRIPTESTYKYLNSGVIVGETEAIMTVLEAMDAPNLPVDYRGPNGNYHFNDQAYYMDLYLRQPVGMKLDYECRIAQNMQDVEPDDLIFKEDKILNAESFSEPSIIHFNGASKDKWGRQPILEKLKLI